MIGNDKEDVEWVEDSATQGDIRIAIEDETNRKNVP